MTRQEGNIQSLLWSYLFHACLVGLFVLGVVFVLPVLWWMKWVLTGYVVGCGLSVVRRIWVDIDSGVKVRSVVGSVVGGGLILVILEGMAWVLADKLPWHTSFGISCGVIFISWLMFFVMLNVVRLILRIPWAPLNIANTVIDEAMGMRAPVGAIAFFLVFIPVLPFILSEDQPLRYRIQQFLGFSLGTTMLLVSLFTILFACWTMSAEISDKQIYLSAVKPIRRGTYLFGKWLGVVLLNSVLVSVIGIAVFCFTVFYMTGLEPMDARDAEGVYGEVLTAREEVGATWPRAAYKIAKQKLEKLENDSPGIVADHGGSDSVLSELQAQELMKWRTIAPGKEHSYVFDGLDQASSYGDFVYLCYMIRGKGMEGSLTGIWLRLNGRWEPSPIFRPRGILQYESIPVSVISDKGKLDIGISNYDKSAITFSPDTLNILYQVDTFGWNFIRAMIVIWVKLAFIAALGVLMATFLSFPVACTTAAIVFVTAWGSEAILDSLRIFGASYDSHYVTIALRWIGYVFARILSKYGEFDTTGLLVNGKYISWGMTLSCVWWVGCVWIGVCGVAGWLIFRNRELARVQV